MAEDELNEEESNTSVSDDVGGRPAGRVLNLLDASAEGPPKVRKARRKTNIAARAVRKAEALSAAGAGALVELDRLRRSVDQLAQGLTAMLATQATHTELLSQLFMAATAPTDPEHQVARLLEQIVVELGYQGGQLRGVGAALAKLPAEIGSAVAGQVTATLHTVR